MSPVSCHVCPPIPSLGPQERSAGEANRAPSSACPAHKGRRMRERLQNQAVSRSSVQRRWIGKALSYTSPVVIIMQRRSRSMPRCLWRGTCTNVLHTSRACSHGSPCGHGRSRSLYATICPAFSRHKCARIRPHAQIAAPPVINRARVAPVLAWATRAATMATAEASRGRRDAHAHCRAGASGWGLSHSRVLGLFSQARLRWRPAVAE